MGSGSWWRAGRAVLAGVCVAAVGGGIAGVVQGGVRLGVSGLVAGVAGLAAAVVTDRLFHGRDERQAAVAARGGVLDSLEPPRGGGDVLGSLLAARRVAPFRGRTAELARLREWAQDPASCPVLLVDGSAGMGKSRLVLEFALQLPEAWAAGWLHAGAGSSAIQVIRTCGDQALVLVDDADGRGEIAGLLDALAEASGPPVVRVILVARSAEGLRALLAGRVEERHRWVLDQASLVEVAAQGGADDQRRWFGEAMTAFAADRGSGVPQLTGRLAARPEDLTQPILILQARALLAVLGDATRGDADLPAASFDQVAGALMDHEKRRWRSMAQLAGWGQGGPPRDELTGKCIVALSLLGSAGDAFAVLRRVPPLRDAPAERLGHLRCHDFDVSPEFARRWPLSRRG